MRNQKIKNAFEKILEPIALGLFALVFIIPTITVINLEPITKKVKDVTDVLGVTTKSDVLIDLIGGTHSVISTERIASEEEGLYIYTTRLNKRESDYYSKPILQIRNNTDEEKIVRFNGMTKVPTRSEIGLIINDQVYKVQKSSGETEQVEIMVLPQGKYDVYLTIESVVGVQFTEDFEMTIQVI